MTRQIRLFAFLVAGFLLSAVSMLSFAGDKHSSDGKTAMQLCMDEQSKSTDTISKACYYTSGPCPDNQNGGTCQEIARFLWTYSGSTYVGGPYSADFSYCPDSVPTWDGSQCVKPDPCKSKSGQAVDDGSLDFGDGSNKRLSMNFPARSDGDYTGQTFCSGGCKAAVDKEVGSAGMNVGGNYYGQFSARFSGQICDAGQSSASPKTTPALIPKNSPEYDCVSKGMGYGYVGDAVKCVAKTSSKETEQKTSETTKADGSKVKETKTDNTVCSGGVCVTTTTTTTTEYNSSGVATGTSTKTDTTTKPDPNSGLGSGGAGSGKEGQGTECGIAGKPPCGVKVDETDVKTDVSVVNQGALDKISAVYDEVRQKMEQVTRPQNWGVTWVYSPPAGACSVLQYGVRTHQFSIDICKPLGYVRDLWSYVIYVMTGLYIWRSARDAMNIV